MTRWLLTGVVASVAWGGAASGQSPRPAAAAPATTPPGDGVIVMKTAGQPDRRVKVVRSERMPDGKVLTEVKDLASGEVYTLTDEAPGGSLDAAQPAATPTPPAPGVPAPPPAAPRPAAAAMPTTPPPAPAGQRPVLTRLFGSREAARTAPPPGGKDKPAAPAAAPRVTAVGVPATATPVAEGEAKPGLFTRVFGGKPTPAPVYQPAPAPAAKPVLPVRAPAPEPTVVPATPVLPVAGGPTQASHTVPAGPDRQMRQEIAQTLQDLKGHARPSFRMDAATALADGRYGSQEEVKTALAAAAKDDPAGVVRGHCIDCLSKLGYAEPEYVRRLRLWTSDPEPAVERAAKEALEKLAPR